MIKQLALVRTLAFSSVLFMLPFDPAFGQDASQVAERLKVLSKQQGMDLSWNSVSGDSSEMILEGVTIKPVDEKDALPIGRIVLNGVSEGSSGYLIETLTTSPFSKSGDGVAVDVSALVMSGLRLPAPDATDPMASIVVAYDRMELASMSVDVGGKRAFALEGLGFEMTAPESGRPMEFSGAAEKFSFDLTLIDDPQYKGIVQALGYDTVNGYLEMAGSWQPEDGRWSLSQYDVSFENVGTFGTTLDFGGFTPDVVKSIRDLSAKMAEAGDGADSTASQMAMLGLLQQVTFNSVSLRFDDASLTNKAIGLVAQMQGQKPADIVNMAKASVPFAMMTLNSPDLTAEVSSAVNTYLDDPKSIEIAAEPDAPVPFAMIMATAMSNPNDVSVTANALWKMLGLKVRANQ